MVSPNRFSIPPTIVKRAAPTPTAAPPPAAHSDDQIRCPTCKSTNCKSARMIFEQGTHEREFTGLGVGLRGGVGLFGGIGQSQSLMAQRCAPPSRRSQLGPVLMTVGCGLIAAFITTAAINAPNAPHGMNDPGPNTSALWTVSVLFLIGAAMGLMWLAQTASWNAAQFPKRLLAWSRIWVCAKCGASWEVADGK